MKYVLPLAAIIVVILYAWDGDRLARPIRWAISAGLAIAALLALYNFTSFYWESPPGSPYVNGYEFFHYYLGAKYAGEVGYTHMYEAAFIADTESGVSPRNRRIRDLDTHRVVAGSTALAKKVEIKGRFTPERWKEFVKDTAFFRKLVKSHSLWDKMLNDKGYNGTPVWGVIGGLLSNRISTDNIRGLIFIAMLDLFLLFSAMVCIAWAFDHRVALLWTIFFGLHYLISAHFTLRAAFLRLDWVMCLVMAVCCLKKGRYGVAGALSAYAALVRVFPVIFGFGIGVKMLFDFYQTRKLGRRYLVYWGWYAGTVVVLVLVSWAYFGGLSPWNEFMRKIFQHDKDISGWRVGFKYVFLMSYDGSAFWHQDLATFFDHSKLAWWTIQLAVIGFSVLAVRRLEDYEALAYCYVLVFFLTAPTYYYHVMLIVPFLLYAGRMRQPAWAAGLIGMYATSMMSYKLYLLWDRGFALYFVISLFLLLYVLYTMAVSYGPRSVLPDLKAANGFLGRFVPTGADKNVTRAQG